MFSSMKAGLRPVLITVAMLAAMPAASAQQAICDQHQKLVDWLASHFQEKRQSMGLSASGTLVELFSSDAGTWTMLRSAPDGTTCVADAGEAFAGDGSTIAANNGGL